MQDSSNVSYLSDYFLHYINVICCKILTYVGATDETSKWWKAVFERRILQGKIGVKLKWWRCPKTDVLWELENYVDAFSQHDLGTEASLERLVEVAREDLSLNNTRHSHRSCDQMPDIERIYKAYDRESQGDINENKGSVNGIYCNNNLNINTMNNTCANNQIYLQTPHSLRNEHNSGKYKIKLSFSEIHFKKNKSTGFRRRSLSWPMSTRQKLLDMFERLCWDNISDDEDDDSYDDDNHDDVDDDNHDDIDDAVCDNYILNNWQPIANLKQARHPRYIEKFDDTDIWRFPSSEEIIDKHDRNQDKVETLKEAKLQSHATDINSHHNSIEPYDSEVDRSSTSISTTLRRCPVENCKVADCLLNRRHAMLKKRKTTVIFQPEVSNFIRKINDAIRKAIIIDDTPVSICKPVTRTKIIGTDISQRTRMATPRRGGGPSRCSDMLEYLEPLKFDVSLKPRTGPPNPLETIQRSLGLENVLLYPDQPADDMEEISTSDGILHSLESGRNKIVATNDWLISTMKDNQEKWEQKPMFVRALRNPSHISLLNVEKISYNYFMKQRRKGNSLYLTGKAAYRYYKLLTLTESKIKISGLKDEKEKLLRKFEWKQKTLLDVVKIARDYYSDPTEVNLHRWKILKKEISTDHDSHTDVQMHVSSIPDYWPLFSFMIITLQFCCLMVLTIRNGINLRGLGTRKFIRVNVPTFLGIETYSRLEEPNPWLGPNVDIFYAAGAVLAPCMRDDLRLYRSTQLKGYKVMNEKNSGYFGCCERKTHLLNVAGTTTLTECINMTNELGHWSRGVICSHRSPARNSVAHVIKPCCVGHHGECEMVSSEHCIFLKGVFHVNCDHCVQVNCLIDVCRLMPSVNDIVPQDGSPWLPGEDTRWQWWRFLTAIPLTYGLVHFGSILLVEIMLMVPLETSAGWHRVMILYCCSAVAGEVIGSIIEPDLPHVGSSSGAGGILGVAVLELFQAWKYLRHPRWEAMKLFSLVALHLFLGTLHLISFFSLIGGLFVGMMGCLTIVPYITFGRRLSHLRFRLVLIGFFLLLPTLIFIQILFQFIQEIRQCPNCANIECVKYTSVMCQTYN